jgi:hypothetical protein
MALRSSAAANWVDLLLGASRYTAPLGRLGKIRSAGITDLRFGNLVDEDWNQGDRFKRTRDLRVPVPLPQGVACYAIAATTGNRAGDLSDRLLGDASRHSRARWPPRESEARADVR